MCRVEITYVQLRGKQGGTVSSPRCAQPISSTHFAPSKQPGSVTAARVNSEGPSVTVKKIEESFLFDFEQMTLLWQERKMWPLGVQGAVRFIAVTLPLIPLSSGSN